MSALRRQSRMSLMVLVGGACSQHWPGPLWTVCSPAAVPQEAEGEQCALPLREVDVRLRRTARRRALSSLPDAVSAACRGLLRKVKQCGSCEPSSGERLKFGQESLRLGGARDQGIWLRRPVRQAAWLWSALPCTTRIDHDTQYFPRVPPVRPAATRSPWRSRGVVDDRIGRMRRVEHSQSLPGQYFWARSGVLSVDNLLAEADWRELTSRMGRPRWAWRLRRVFVRWRVARSGRMLSTTSCTAVRDRQAGRRPAI